MRWLFAKDLRILLRSRLLVGVLVLYPVAIALLIGFALSRAPAKPRVAVVDETAPGVTVALGGSRIGLAEYTDELFSQVDVVRVATRAQAAAKVGSGAVVAAIVIPADIVAKLSSGVSQAQVEVIYNGNAIEQSLTRSAIDAALAQANLALSQQIRAVAVRDIDLLLAGGQLGVLGSSQEIIGLSHIAPTLRGVATRTPAGGDRATLTRIAGFAAFAASNLGIAKDVLTTVSQPITVKSKLLHGRRTPLDTYAVVVAVSVSLMLLCVLLAAGGVALEREEHTLARLTRLVRREALLAEKALLAAACAFVVALAMMLGVGAFVPLDASRVALWALALCFGAVAFGALGVAIGSLTGEVRAASLLVFVLALPLAFLALVPGGSVASGLYAVIQALSFIFPFKAALQALDAAVNRASPGIAVPIAHLLGLTLCFGALARLGLRRVS